jgi:hypothetical protein
MKPYADLNGKVKWSLFWGDKINKKIKKLFKKSGRKKNKITDCND